MRSLLDVLYRERRALFGCLVITLGIALVAATAHASRRRSRAARQARHHSGSVVVGDRDARHHRLWRRGAGDRARKTDRLRHHCARPRRHRTSGRHHRHRLRRPDSPPQLHRHLGHDRARAAVRRARCRRHLRHHGVVARAGGGSRRSGGARRRPRPFDVFHRRRRSGGGAQEGAAAARRRPVLRRGGGVAPRAPLGHRDRHAPAPICWCSTPRTCAR